MRRALTPTPRWLASLAAALAFACQTRPPVDPQRVGPVVRPRVTKPSAKVPGVPALHATELSRVQSATFGPYLGMRPDGALVVWAELDSKGRRFLATPLTSEGRPMSRPNALGNAPEQLGVVAVRAMNDGYALLFTRPGEKAELVEAQCVTAKGESRGAPNLLAELSGRALWVELVAVEQGAVALYAVRASERQRADVWAVALDSQCRTVERTLLFRNALAWQAGAAPKGAFVSAVQVGDATGGSVSVSIVDATAKVRATTRVVESGADLDLDAVSLGERFVLGWTDQRSVDPVVVTAAVDASGKLVSPPARATSPEGEQALLRLIPPAAGGKRAFIALERLEARLSTQRYFTLSALDDAGRLSGARAELGYAKDDGSVPEFAAASDGLAALTVAPVCRRQASCEGSSASPTYVRFDTAMKVVASEPLRLEPLAGEPAELGFGLGCWGAKCVAISALTKVPAPIFAVQLEARSSVWAAPVRDLERSEPPRVKEFESVATAESVARLSVASAAGQDVIAFITDFDDNTPWKLLARPAADGRREPLRAQISLLRAATPERPRRDTVQVSLRAHAVGGVALAPGDASRGELAVAWAGLDAGMPQLFITLFDKNGNKVSQRMLTHKKGELSDIALAWVGDGWVVAWVDERSGDAEVYATKVDPKLNRTAPEQRITNAAGVASDLTIAYDGKFVELAWSDARGADVAAHADIYTARLRPRDAAREGDERRVAATRAHSFAPALQPARDGFALAWVERGDDTGAGRVAFVELGADGNAGALTTTALPGNAEPRAVTLDCPNGACRFLVTADGSDQSELFGGVWRGAKIESLKALLPLADGAAGNAAPILRGDIGWLADKANDRARLRRLQLEW